MKLVSMTPSNGMTELVIQARFGNDKEGERSEELYEELIDLTHTFRFCWPHSDRQEDGSLTYTFSLSTELDDTIEAWVKKNLDPSEANQVANEKTKPITPNESRRAFIESLPNEVLEAFNELITKRFDDNTFYINSDEVLHLIAKKLNKDSAQKENDAETRANILDNEWLNVGSIYRNAGWNVEREGSVNGGEPNFIFSRSKMGNIK